MHTPHINHSHTRDCLARIRIFLITPIYDIIMTPIVIFMLVSVIVPSFDILKRYACILRYISFILRYITFILR